MFVVRARILMTRPSWLTVLVVGALFRPATASEPVVLEVSPATVVLDGPRGGCQLLISGRGAGGSVSDLTAAAEIRVEANLVAIEPGGYLRPRRDGETMLTIRAGGHVTRVPVTVRGVGDPRPSGFRREVIAALAVGGCNQGACHGSPQGKNGFHLSLRGADPAADLLALTRDQFGRRADRNDPDASLVLRKGIGIDPHEGGVRWRRDGDAVIAVRSWLAGGMPDDPPMLPPIARLEVLPGPRVLSTSRQQVAVLAHFADGSTRDATRFTVFSSSDGAIADVSETGLVEFHGSGEVAILCRYLDALKAVRLTFVAARPEFRWNDPPENNAIDRHLFAKLRLMQIEPSGLCTDAEFLRRTSLDLTGSLPTPDTVRAFLSDSTADKRLKLIDRLLEAPGYADFWALKWADLLRVSRRSLQPKGALGLHEWLRTQLRANVPFDRVVRELLITRGSSASEPAVNFYRIGRDPQTLAETTALLFCGVRLQCAKCHNHPTERWTQDDYAGFAAYFARVRLRPDPNAGGEVMYLDRAGEVAHPRTGQPTPPRPLGGSPAPIAGDRREALADWLLAPGNPFFARSVVNRAWYHLFGRGIVEPVDDFRDANPPASAELLDYLAGEFTAHGHDLKHLLRLIVMSRTYQLSSQTTPTNADDVKYFSHAIARPLTAEQLLDAVCDVTGLPEQFKGLPAGTRAVQLPDGEGNHPLLKSFGQPARELACECERDQAGTLPQALLLATGPTLNDKLRQPDNRLGRLLAANRPANEMLEELMLAAVGRPPRPAEIAALREHLAKSVDVRRAWEDVLWALLNSRDFLERP
jgi:hypothetical protein